MIAVGQQTRVYFVLGATDMRKSINGLSMIVAEVLEEDPFSEQLFVFSNRQRDKLKILHWERNGFWLYYKRLERGRFKWPAPAPGQQALRLHQRELQWLLDGFSIEAQRGFQPVMQRALA